MKDEREAAFLRESGRVSHNVGVQMENARSPHVTEFIVGTVRSDWKDERRLRGDILIAGTTSRPEKVHEES